MSGVAVSPERRPLVGQVWGALVAVWGGLVGLVPHVLHHIGPLAGAALLAGATGRALFAAIGFVAAIPFLRRLHRRFKSWRAPAIALAIFAAMFALSSFVIGPVIADSSDATPSPSGQQGHEQHH